MTAETRRLKIGKHQIERLAVRYFKRRAERADPRTNTDAIHYLNPAERQHLRHIERMAVLRAAAAGAFAASLGAIVNILARPLLGEEPEHPDWAHLIGFTAFNLAIAIPVAIVELSFIYWNAIISVHRLAEATGVVLFRGEDDEDHAEDEVFAAVLAKAALEIPNAPRPQFGIDPRREASKLQIVLATFVYKAKVSMSNFLLRRLLARAFGRAGLRSWIPFIAVPVTATWDAFVCRRVLREARLRALGRSAAHELVDTLVPAHVEPSALLREALFRAVATAVVRSADFHPNLVELFDALRERLGTFELDDLDDTDQALATMQQLPVTERRIALAMLVVACTLDGRVGRKEWRVLDRAYAQLDLTTPRSAIRSFKRGLLHGDELGPTQLGRLVPDLPWMP